ncbi:hypothetical protein Tco_0029503 [Tanacetum coccineum]
MTKRAIRISQSKALSPVVDETAPPTRGDRYGEAFPTATSLDAGQDRENIPKTSAMPHESFPRVTSLGGDEGDAEKDSSRSTNKGSESTGDLANVLSSIGATNILASEAKVQEQMSLQLARELQEEFVHDDQSIREKIERDAEIARIHAEEGLRQMINELDRSNVMINKHMAEMKKMKMILPLKKRLS